MVPTVRWVALLVVVACGPRDVPDDGPFQAMPFTPPVETTPTTPPVDPGDTRPVNDRDFLPAAVAALGAATERVRVAEYLLYDDLGTDALIAAIGDAAGRGVRVQVLADETGEETASVLAALALRGAETALDHRDVTLHNKLIVADGIVLVGSHNVTSAALTANHEGSMLVRDDAVAAWYADWFDAVWEEPAAMVELAALDRDDLVPLADRQVTDALVACLDGATSEVDLVMYALAWDAAYPGSEVDRVMTALEAAHARGVATQVVLDRSEWVRDHAINDAAVARLLAAGLDVWFADASVTTHAKVLRCDDVVLVGDTNWSYTGLALVHGTTLRVALPEVASAYGAWIRGIQDAGQPAAVAPPPGGR